MSEKATLTSEKKRLSSVKANLDKCPKEKVKIPVNELNKSDDSVEVSINGYVYQIKRGVEVEVPKPVKKLLERANII